jgi:cell division protein FtsL
VISSGLLAQCKHYFWSPAGRQCLFVLLVLVTSALAVIFAAHATRARYANLQSEQHVSDNLDSEYEKLLLEHSVWAGYNRVDQLARETLQMRSPDQTNLLIVRPEIVSLDDPEAVL